MQRDSRAGVCACVYVCNGPSGALTLDLLSASRLWEFCILILAGVVPVARLQTALVY